MNPVVRQRLVGTLVLLAMAVVFWPIIFVSPEMKTSIVIDEPPPVPVIDTEPLPDLISPKEKISSTVVAPSYDEEAQALADQKTLINAEQDVAQTAVNLAPADTLETTDLSRKAPAPIVPDSSGFPITWVLQVATVSTQERAASLVDQLVSKGYEAFASSFASNDKILWRVQIGPKADLARFDPIKLEVDKALRVESVIVRYRQ